MSPDFDLVRDSEDRVPKECDSSRMSFLGHELAVEFPTFTQIRSRGSPRAQFSVASIVGQKEPGDGDASVGRCRVEAGVSACGEGGIL